MRLQLKQNQRMNEVEKKEVKRSFSTSNFLKKENKHFNHQQQENIANVQSLRYMDGLIKHSQPQTLCYNQSLKSLPKSEQNISSAQSSVFQNIDQNILNNTQNFQALHFHTPSMDKEIKNLTQKLALERSEIESELKKTQKEVIKWREKYEQLYMIQQNKGNPQLKSVSSLYENESLVKSNLDLSGIQNRNFNDSQQSLINQFGNTIKSQVSEKDVKLLAQKFALERVELENQIKCLQTQHQDFECEIFNQIQENQKLQSMCKEIEKEKEKEIVNFKFQLQENENELKKNIQQEILKLGENFNKEKNYLEKKQSMLEEETEQLKRENQTLVDTIHSLNLKSKSQNDLIQNLTSKKSEQTLLFQKVSYLENELQLITDQLQREQENKLSLLDRVDTERNNAEMYLTQLEDQKKLIDQLNMSNLDINNKFQDIFNQFKQEQSKCEQLRIENQRFKEKQEQFQVSNDFLKNYKQEQEKNSDLLEQINEQAEMIDQMREQIEMLDNLNKTATRNHQADLENIDNLKNELKTTFLEYRSKMLEEYLSSSQKNLGEKEGTVGILEIELQNKQKLYEEGQEKVYQLQEQLREMRNKEQEQYEGFDFKQQIQQLKDKIQQKENENKLLIEQKTLSENLVNKMIFEKQTRESEIQVTQQQSIQQNSVQIVDLIKLIQEKDSLISELQVQLQQKEPPLFTEYNLLSKKTETEKSEINIRNLETVYEQRINQVQKNQIIEEERLTNIIQSKNGEIKNLQYKIDEYLRKMDALSTELEKLQDIINQKDLLNKQITNELSQLKTLNIQNNINQLSSDPTQPSYSVLQSQNQSLKIELEQSKQKMQEKGSQDEQINSNLELALKQVKKELDIKNEEYVKMLAQQSQQLVASFSKDNIINQKEDEIVMLKRKISQMETENKELQFKLNNGLTENFEQAQISHQKENESYMQQIYQQGQIINSQREEIKQLSRKYSFYQQENIILQDQYLNKNQNDADVTKALSSTSIESDTQVVKLQKEILILTQFIESQESTLKLIQKDSVAMKKDLEETREKYQASENNLNSMRNHIIQITDDNQKLVNKINEISFMSPQQSQKNQQDVNFENYKLEVEHQKQIYIQQIQDLTKKVEKCQFDKMILSQELERLKDVIKQKEKQVEIFKEQIKENCQTELQKNIKNLTQNFMSEKQCLEERIKTLESENNLLKCEQSVIVDETLTEQKKSIEWEKEIRKNVEDEIKCLVQKYLQQKYMYERIIAELKIQLGTLQKQLEEHKEIIKLNEIQLLNNSQNENLNKMIELKNSENRSLQIRLESTDRQKNEEIKKLKREIYRMNEEILNKSSFEVYAERIGYQSAIIDGELKIKEQEDQIEQLRNKIQQMKNQKYESIELVQQIQNRNAWQIEFSRLIDELKNENKQLNQSLFEQEQTIAKLHLQNASLIISDSYYILSNK